MRILFVCMGNICRSPTAEGVFRRLAQERAPQLAVEIDSAGTHDYHVGEPPDARSVAAAARRGIDLRSLRARQVSDTDFERFDLIVAMDRLNHVTLIERAPAAFHDRIRLFMEFAGDNALEEVLDLAEEAAEGLLDEVLKQTETRRRR
jgi:protein-tyrosine phosphatase